MGQRVGLGEQTVSWPFTIRLLHKVNLQNMQVSLLSFVTQTEPELFLISFLLLRGNEENTESFPATNYYNNAAVSSFAETSNVAVKNE